MELKPKACSQCQHCVEFQGNFHYCNATRKVFTSIEPLFWEIECGTFVRVLWPLPINQTWRNYMIITRRATNVRSILSTANSKLKRLIR
jgi:hypothetical protein